MQHKSDYIASDRDVHKLGWPIWIDDFYAIPMFEYHTVCGDEVCVQAWQTTGSVEADFDVRDAAGSLELTAQDVREFTLATSWAGAALAACQEATGAR